MRELRIILFALAVSVPAFAHGVDITYKVADSVVIVRCGYSGAESLKHAQVVVQSPNGEEFQNGRTDAEGRFAFVPDKPGEWLFVVDDELGHRDEIRIPVSESAIGQQAGGGTMPAWQKGLTGVSLIIGLTGMLLWWKVRQAHGKG